MPSSLLPARPPPDDASDDDGPSLLRREDSDDDEGDWAVPEEDRIGPEEGIVLEADRRREKQEQSLKGYWENVFGQNPLGLLVRVDQTQWAVQDWNEKKSELAVNLHLVI